MTALYKCFPPPHTSSALLPPTHSPPIHPSPHYLPTLHTCTLPLPTLHTCTLPLPTLHTCTPPTYSSHIPLPPTHPSHLHSSHLLTLLFALLPFPSSGIQGLGLLCGRHVMVVQCSSLTDKKAISSVLEGLAQDGSWACFANFQTLSSPTLAVFSQMVCAITNALRERSGACVLLSGREVIGGREGTLNPHVRSGSLLLWACPLLRYQYIRSCQCSSRTRLPQAGFSLRPLVLSSGRSLCQRQTLRWCSTPTVWPRGSSQPGCWLTNLWFCTIWSRSSCMSINSVVLFLIILKPHIALPCFIFIHLPPPPPQPIFECTCMYGEACACEVTCISEPLLPFTTFSFTLQVPNQRSCLLQCASSLPRAPSGQQEANEHKG